MRSWLVRGAFWARSGARSVVFWGRSETFWGRSGAFWSILRAFWSVQGGVLDHFGFKQKSDARAMIFLGAAKANRMRKHIFARAINEFWGRPQRARHSRPKRRARNLRPKCASEAARVSENAITSVSLINKTRENDLKRFPILYV